MKSYTNDFADNKGNCYTVKAEGEKLNLNKNYKLQHEFTDKKKRNKGVFTSDIGIHSNGFAGIMGLALIIAIAGVIIAYLVLKF